MPDIVKYKGALTRKQIERYLKKQCCPFCGSNDTSGEDLSEDGDLSQRFVCEGCRMPWVEHYALDTIDRASIHCGLCRTTISDGEDVVLDDNKGFVHAVCVKPKPERSIPVVGIINDLKEFIAERVASHWVLADVLKAMQELIEEETKCT
jgi:hypothetical protein